MTAFAVVIAQCIGCVGFGATVLRGLRLGGALSWHERLWWSFAVGFGVLGWVVFFAGVSGALGRGMLIALLLAGACGIGFLGRPPARTHAAPLQGIEWTLVALVCAALAFDFLEALAPPADADTLAYHFALPKQFLGAGRIEFVPRAVDGAVPLGVQMTYLPALALGGERALTLWTWASGWALAALFYGISRRFLDRGWALAATLVLVTTPAVVYGGGSGQVEVRIALFVLVAVFAAAAAIREGDVGHAVLAGMAAGFFMAGKYTGLLFVAAMGLVMVLGRRRIACAGAFGLAALLAGGQWYVWNALHTGDPVFPMLYGWLDYPDRGLWDAAHAESLEVAFFETQRAVATNPFWLLAYPFKATLAASPVFESVRTGLGAYPLLAVPFALAGLWRVRHRVLTHPLGPAALTVVMYYALWFFIGSSLRIRHLLPVLPVVLLCLSVAARRWCDRPAYLFPLGAALAFTVAAQLAGHALFSASYARHLVSGEDREAFHERTVTGYGPVPWVNANLESGDRLALTDRQLVYLIEAPTFLAHPVQQALVDLAAPASDPNRFLRQLRSQAVTHLLVSHASDGGSPFAMLARALEDAGCANRLATLDTRTFASRTLPALSAATGRADVLGLTPNECPLP